MQWAKNIILQYFKELNRQAPVCQEELEYRANKLINDIERTSKARKDFKEEK